MIDGLIIVPDNKKIVLRFRQHPYNIILKMIDILKLIDQNILKFFLPCRQNVLPLNKKLIAVEKHIIKVQLASCLTCLTITAVDLPEYFIRTTGRIIVFQRNPISLDNTDLFCDFFREVPFFCQISTVIQNQLF